MARKTQISKEVILGAALEMLIENGYSSINIKTLSARIGCSTQPLVWHFQNMEGLRRALADYALMYANDKMRPTVRDAIKAFEQVGRAYIKIAMHEPNLFRFVFLNESGCYPTGSVEMLTGNEDNAKLIKKIARKFQIPEHDAAQYLQDTIIYTHGFATLFTTEIIRLTEAEIIAMVNRAGDSFPALAGVPLEKIPRHMGGKA